MAKVAQDPEIDTPQTQENTVLSTKKSMSVRWENLTYDINLKDKTVNALKGVSGSLNAGELVCIIGASGAGKTSLLNVLAGRTTPGGVHSINTKDAVFLNGAPTRPQEYRQEVAYVMQEDAIFATAKPIEALTFSAIMRLGVHNAPERKALVEELISDLSLEKCKDSMVGSILIKGISGGEKKRAAIGIELITDPSLLFLDEPTSGLDTVNAYNVVKILKTLASRGCAILCTIHQPSSEIFELFDKVIFMSEGSIVYNGPVTKVTSYFAERHHQCPAHYNPADYVMFLLQDGEQKKAVASLITEYKEKCAKEAHSIAANTWTKSKNQKSAGFVQQVVTLTSREARNAIRDKATLGARFGTTIGLTLILALIFKKIGDSEDINSHWGATVNIAIFAMFGAAQPTILTFPFERPVFVREYVTGTYGVVPYFLSKTFVEMPLVFIQALVTWLVAYWIMGLHGNFAASVFTSFLNSMAASSASILVGCAVTDVKTAMEAAPAVFVPQILFAGFFIKMEQVPVWLRWIQWICSLKYATNMHTLVEFKYLWDDECFDISRMGDETCINFDYEKAGAAAGIIEFNDVDTNLYWAYAAVLIAITVGFRTIACLALKFRAHTML